MNLDDFGPGFVDEDEWRDAPLRHRFVHGGFEGTDTRFSIYLPPAEQYGGRCLHWLEGGAAGHDRTIEAGGPLVNDALAHGFALGAYVVESNQGHIADEPARPKPENSVLSHRASVATARYSRELAATMYGEAPHHAYVFGISGGGLRSIIGLERGEGTWDGAVPCAIPHSGMFYALAEHAARTLGSEVHAFVEAADVGSDRDPFDVLSVEQRAVMADLYRSGYARGAEFMLRPGYYPVGFGMTTTYEHDPGYFDAFWSEPGYLGHDDPALLESMRIDAKATVVQVMTPQDLLPPDTPPETAQYMAAMLGGLDAPVGAFLDGLDEDDLEKLSGATLSFASGAAKGRLLYCTAAMGPVAIGASYSMGEVFHGVEPGDEIHIDNRHHLAFRYAYRHQITVEEERFPELHPEWRHLMVDGRPVYRQRRPAWTFDGTFASEAYLHRFAGKMLLVQNAHDGTNWPIHAHNYATRLRDGLGAAIDESFRLYWTEHATHGPASFYPPGAPPVVTARAIDYSGVLYSALADLIAWVEEEVEPRTSTGYTWDADNRLHLAATVEERGGLQPVVHLTVDGGVRSETKVGQAVSLRVEATAAVGALVDVEWDCEGVGSSDHREELRDAPTRVTCTHEHTYDEPGAYFPAVRVWAQRDGDVSSELFRIPNLARARVVVQ
jgi:hypothetical protein